MRVSGCASDVQCKLANVLAFAPHSHIVSTLISCKGHSRGFRAKIVITSSMDGCSTRSVHSKHSVKVGATCSDGAGCRPFAQNEFIPDIETNVLLRNTQGCAHWRGCSQSSPHVILCGTFDGHRANWNRKGRITGLSALFSMF